MTAPSIGIHVPSVATDGLDTHTAYTAFFREAEALGFDTLWVEDRLFHPAPMADALMLLAWAAAHTEKMTLGTAVMLLNLRQAPVVARQVSTLQHLSGGRAMLGISLGGRPEEYAGLRLPMNRRAVMFQDSIETLKALLSGDAVSLDGDFFPLKDAIVRPAAPTPLLIGGLADAAIARAGAFGDGWIMGPFGPVSDFTRGRDLARRGAGKAGKDPDKLIYGRLVYVAVDDDRAVAKAQLTRFLHGYYGPTFDVEKHAIFGPAEEVRQRLRAHIEAGISHLMLAVPTLDLDHLTHLADDVVPALRG